MAAAAMAVEATAAAMERAVEATVEAARVVAMVAAAE